MTPLNSELQSLSDWLNIERPAFSWKTVSALSPYWREKKLIRPTGRERSTAECHCDFDHEEEVFYAKGEPVILCSHTGCWRRVEKEELRFWRFDGNVMADILAALFECGGRPTELIGGRLWNLGMTAHRIGGITRDIYFAPRMSASTEDIYARLPKDGTQAVLISGSSRFQQSEHFKTDNVFRMSDILVFSGSELSLKLAELDSRLGGVPPKEKKKPTAADRGKYAAALNKALYEELKSAYDFYVNGEGLRGGKYPPFTMRRIADLVGCAPATIQRILNKKDKSGRKEYKEIDQRWQCGQTREGIIRFGDAYFPSVKGFDR